MQAEKENLYIKRFWLIVVSPFILMFLWIIGVLLFGDLPSFEQLESPKSNLASEIYSSDGKVLGKYYIENRSNIKYEELSPNVINALKATEDIRFESHSGVDIKGLGRVMIRTILLRQSNSGGGSTITQQLAKNLFPREHFSSIFDKISTKVKEWIVAIRLERNYTKNEILAMYLNTVDFGSNAYGIKSAARTFFNKLPKDLSMEESALLVGLLQAPSKYSPVRNPQRAMARRNTVLAQLNKYDFIQDQEFERLKATPIKLVYQREDHTTGLATYFREYLRLELTKWCKEHKKSDGGEYNLYTDGLRIYTTINSKMQRYAEEAVAEHLSVFQNKFFDHWKGRVPWGSATNLIDEAMRRSERFISLKEAGISESKIKEIFKQKVPMSIFSWKGNRDTVLSPIDSIKYYKYFLQTGLMAMDPHTGHVKAWVGGIDYRYFKYDHVREGRRQVGSTFKPFLYALAMQEGYSPCFRVANDPVTIMDGNGQPWTPANSTNEDDGKIMTLKEALANSVNRISAYLMQQFGPEAVIEVARKMGITSPLDAVPALCLGVSDVSVYEMVGAYSTFVNRGVYTEPIYISRIEDKNGNILEERIPRKVEAISEETAYLMLNLLQGVVNYGTSASLRGRYKLRQYIGGKTGTTQDQSDGWFMGITPDLVTGCWVGNEDPKVHFRSLDLGQGARMALPIWAFFMQRVYADKSLNISQGPFDPPSSPLSVETDCSQYTNQ